MIMSKSAIDTVCMYVVMVGLAVTPLLESCLTVGESCSAHRAGSTFAFACWRLHHLRHLPPIVHLGVAISCTAGTSGIGTSETLGASYPCGASSRLIR